MLVIGWNGLKKRFDSQCSDSEKLNGFADGLKEQLQLLERKLDGSAKRYEELKSKQRKYHLRLLHVMRKLEVLRAKGLPLSSIELKYYVYIELMIRVLTLIM